MSMHEALRGVREKWEAEDAIGNTAPPSPASPLEEAEALVLLAKREGQIDPQSATWYAVAAWCAREVITAQRGLEHGLNERIQGRIEALRELLALPNRPPAQKPVVDEFIVPMP